MNPPNMPHASPFFALQIPSFHSRLWQMLQDIPQMKESGLIRRTFVRHNALFGKQKIGNEPCYNSQWDVHGNSSWHQSSRYLCQLFKTPPW